jgi:hypothetical protein
LINANFSSEKFAATRNFLPSANHAKLLRILSKTNYNLCFLPAGANEKLLPRSSFNVWVPAKYSLRINASFNLRVFVNKKELVSALKLTTKSGL